MSLAGNQPLPFLSSNYAANRLVLQQSNYLLTKKSVGIKTEDLAHLIWEKISI